MKNIFDYFSEDIDYPTFFHGDILPFGVFYDNVSSKLLDGFINYCKPVLAYTTHEKPMDTNLSDRNISYHYPSEFGKWKQFKGDKTEFLSKLKNEDICFYHTKIHMFGEDVFLICEILDENDIKIGYCLFWYDISGRCGIGRFKTDDTLEDIDNSINHWLQTENDNTPFDKLPLSFLKGWISW